MLSRYKRLAAFAERNRGAVIRNGLRLVLVWPWVRFRMWRVFFRFLPMRHPEKWIFMGGCYNSGTTILREVLSSHPDIGSLPREGVELTSVFPNLEKNGWQRMWHRNSSSVDQMTKRDPQDAARVAARDWSVWWPRGKKVFLEKSIVHGAWMPFLERGFDNCYFIGVIRNGYCAAEGIRRRARPFGQAATDIGADRYKMSDTASQWVYSNECLQRDSNQVARYHEVRYEDLAAEPEKVLREIFQFIGVDDSPMTMVDRKTVSIGGRRFVIRNDNPASLARLSEVERKEYFSVAGQMMKQLGYDEVAE